MKLFFETSTQACCFAAMIPFGYFLSLGLSVRIRHSVVRFAADLLLLIVSAAVVVFFLLFTGEPSLRLYHILGILTCSVLYMAGIGSGWKRFFKQAGKNKMVTKRNNENE